MHSVHIYIYFFLKRIFHNHIIAAELVSMEGTSFEKTFGYTMSSLGQSVFLRWRTYVFFSKDWATNCIDDMMTGHTHI